MTWILLPHLKNCRRIVVKNLHCDMFIGAYEHEKNAPQSVLLNIETFVTTSNEQDDLENAFNYDLIVHGALDIARREHIALQETLIDQIADYLLGFERVVAVRVKSEKTQAYDCVESVGVEIYREK